MIETPASDDFSDLQEFFGSKKKKKVKFAPEEIPNPEPARPDPAAARLSDAENDLSFDKMKKKKKKKVAPLEESTFEQGVAEELENMALTPADDGEDYSYESLLTRAFSIMREKDPNRDVESRRKLVLRPPQVLRVGTKKSSLVNFVDICRLLHRAPQHVQSFLLVELGTTGSVDGNNQLIIKGRFEQRQIENVLRRYIREYVSCHTCRSPDTSLQKDTRLFFLQCESCGSRCSVASVKSGFQAVTSKRAAIRAKAQ